MAPANLCRGLRETRLWFSNSSNVDRTVRALDALTAEFTQPNHGDTVVAIELLNEPFPYTDEELETLRRFYQTAYYTVRRNSPMTVALDDGFRGLGTWFSFMNEPQFSNVAMDTHVYAMYVRSSGRS